MSERLNEADQTIQEMQELVTEHEVEIGVLNTRVWSLEERNRHCCRSLGSRGWSSHGPGTSTRGNSSGGSSICSLSSSGDSLYGLAPLEGFIGEGSHEFPMTLVSVDCIEDIEELDLAPPLPVPPPRWLLEERLRPAVVLQVRLDINYQNWLVSGPLFTLCSQAE